MGDKIPLKSKAAIYIRVSTQMQVDKDSLQVQKRELIAYADYILGIKEYEVFDDPGYSGKNTDRPKFQEMMKRLRTGEFSHLLVWKIDRISRNLLDFSAMYKELQQIGVTFVSKNEQFDTSSAIGEAMLKIILVFAELERNMTSERVTAVMISRAKEGKWNGGRIPFGYDWNKETKTVSINQKEAKVVQLLYDLFDEKRNLKEVANALNDRGLRTKSGAKWSPVTVHVVLTNIWYTGTYLYNRCAETNHQKVKDPSEWEFVPNHHQPLISQEDFERHAKILSMNRRGGHKVGDTYDTRFTHIFAGLVICGNCGANVTSNRGKPLVSGWIPTTYGCANRRKHGDKCPNVYRSEVYFSSFMLPLISAIVTSKSIVTESTTEAALEKYILKHMEHPVKHITGLRRLLDLLKANDKAMEYFYPLPSELKDGHELADGYRDQIRKLKTSMQRLQSLYLHGDNAISEADYISERGQLMKDITIVEHKLAEIATDDEESDEEFVLKASEFVMIDRLLSYKKGSSGKLVSTIDPRVPKHFFNTIITRIVLTSGNITKIEFKNGVAIEFSYE